MKEIVEVAAGLPVLKKPQFGLITSLEGGDNRRYFLPDLTVGSDQTDVCLIPSHRIDDVMVVFEVNRAEA